jgi:prepilin-type processing-associated H-X9-DG protein
MANWYFYNNQGQKFGPIDDAQLQALAANGTITSNTLIETEQGNQAKAEKIKGLIFAASAVPPNVEAVPLPSATFIQPVAETIYDTPYSFRDSNVGGGKAIASLVCGICSMVFCGGLFILPILGLILGILGLKSKNQGMAIAGIILSGFGLFLSLILPGLLLPAVQAAREAARRMQCVNNEKQIAIAFHNFQDTYNAFPALYTVDENDQPLHSWRVLILPFLDETVLYNEIRLDEPWDSEYNQQFHSRMPSVYACPSNHNKTTDQCCYSAIAGKGWNKGKTVKDKEGILVPAKKPGDFTGTEIASVTDGTSSTLLIIEVKEPFCWMNPAADKTFNDLEEIGTEHSSVHPGGFNGALADGSVRFFSNTIDPYILNALGTRDGDEPISP